MRIVLSVGVLVVPAMDRDPARRGVLHATHGKDGEQVLQPFLANQAAMREQPMVAEVDAERAEYVEAQNYQGESGPTEEPRQQRQQRDEMVNSHRNGVRPDDSAPVHGGRQGKTGRRGDQAGGRLG